MNFIKTSLVILMVAFFIFYLKFSEVFFRFCTKSAKFDHHTQNVTKIVEESSFLNAEKKRKSK